MKIIGGSLRGRNFHMPSWISPTQNVTRKAVFDILGDISGLEFLDLYAGSGAVGLEAYSRGAKRVTLVEKDLRCCEVIRNNIELVSGSAQTEGKKQISPASLLYGSKKRDKMTSHLPEKDLIAASLDALEKKKAMMAGENLEVLRLIEADSLPFIKQAAQTKEKFDIVFLDPPFDRGLGKKTLKTLSAYDILHPNCLVIIQEHKKETLPEAEGRVRLIKAKNYGNSVIAVYQDQLEQ